MTRKEQKEMRRMQIIKTALHLFTTQSYHGTKTWQISKEAGISEGLLFHYFPTKENLLEELVKLGVYGMKFPIQMNTENPLEFFKQFADMLFSEFSKNPFYSEMFVFMAQLKRTEGIPPKIKQLADSFDTVTATVPVIEAGQKLGVIRRGDPLALSNLYWCTIHGISEQYSARPEIALPNPEWIIDMLREENYHE